MTRPPAREAIEGAAAPYPFRTHQQRALDALAKARADGRRRAWVVLPPGAGKTLVGLEEVRRLAEVGEIGQAVVLGPNTAIQAQWAATWDGFLPPGADPAARADTDRVLDTFLTALTYQAVATFDDGPTDDGPTDDGPTDDGPTDDGPTDDGSEADGTEADGGGADGSGLLGRLHPHGRQLVDQLVAAGPIALVLDECHHLLEVWGRLLAELLDLLPEARVIGLTATPPTTMTREQQRLVDELFGDTVFATSIPAVVKEGDLAPFAELVWLTRPTAEEREWLAGQAQRFTELTTSLTDPTFGSVPFLDWLDRRFVTPVGHTVRWQRLVHDEPALADAALRMHHAGLLALPEGARLAEQHRRDPTPDDWVALLGDWVEHHLRASSDPADERALEAVRRALPSVGYQLTRRGVRRGGSPVDRVLARSAAKPQATVDIVARERLNLGSRLRMLVLCDFEHATATLSADLREVLSAQAGSATLVLRTLVQSPDTAPLAPLLVSARTIAGAPATLQALVAHVAVTDAALAGRLRVTDAEDGISRLEGPWTSRRWVGHVTRFFEAGGTRVLVGTRALLGEGWDARRVTGVVDLTAATTPTAVTQTRGRALRLDPSWPEKVALTWTVVCVAPEHPLGEQDWGRLVRKHTGFFGVDADGEVVDGVAHLDPSFSPFRPPPVEDFAAVDARMLVRSEARPDVAERWGVGTPYADTVVTTVRLVSRRPAVAASTDVAPADPGVPLPGNPEGLDVRRAAVVRPAAAPSLGLGGVLVVLAVVLGMPAAAPLLAATLLAALAQAARWWHAGVVRRQLVGGPPDVSRVAAAVAEAMAATGTAPVGAEAVRVHVDAEGDYRCHLDGVAPEVSTLFATALAEAVSPMAEPRYVLPRWTVAPRAPGVGRVVADLRNGVRDLRPDGEVWHAVPSLFGARADLAQAYARAWNRWVGGGEAVFTGNPQGAGILAANRGSDPFDVTAVMRTAWR